MTSMERQWVEFVDYDRTMNYDRTVNMGLRQTDNAVTFESVLRQIEKRDRDVVSGIVAEAQKNGEIPSCVECMRKRFGDPGFKKYRNVARNLGIPIQDQCEECSKDQFWREVA